MTTAISAEPVWDGKVYPYIAPKQLKIDARLKLHREAVAKLDPITYEVLRYALWNLNVEHGNTIVKVSGSPIAAYSHDFNPALLDENGDYRTVRTIFAVSLVGGWLGGQLDNGVPLGKSRYPRLGYFPDQ